MFAPSQAQLHRFRPELLQDKAAYPHKVKGIKMLETHISWIFLTGKYAYKVKKPVKFGEVLDFSTLQKRKKYCSKEVQLNKELCPDIYLRVDKIIKNDNNASIVSLSEKGNPIEYVVVMKEMPQRYRLDKALESQKVTDEDIKNLAFEVSRFHTNAYTNKEIQKFGSIKEIKNRVKENFDTIQQVTGKRYSDLEKNMTDFLSQNKKILDSRRLYGKIKDVHGDLYLENIFFRNRKFYLYDRIEFNDTLRYSDVVEDVAHLSMDLDFRGKTKTKERFLGYYKKMSDEDQYFFMLLYFYMCYRAMVKAKVYFFRQHNEENKKKHHEKIASKLVSLAESYSNNF